jgi:hypothetical protein
MVKMLSWKRLTKSSLQWLCSSLKLVLKVASGTYKNQSKSNKGTKVGVVRQLLDSSSLHSLDCPSSISR